MTPEIISPSVQLGCNQQITYNILKPQCSIIECGTLNLVDLIDNYFVEDQIIGMLQVQFSGEIPELGILAPYQLINVNIGINNNDAKLKLYNIVSDKKRLLLRKPIEVTPVFHDGMWTMENKDLDIISMSTDYKECLKDFYDEVFFVWEEYGQEDDDKLTNGAKDLKRKILRHIGEKVFHHPYDIY
ncbi:hypothetical protein GH146_02245 [archaeon]|jgi:hypothetical protein|nr:hypothetical protein [archaeon]